MSARHGGPAFPVAPDGHTGHQRDYRGMTLRDYFAGQALAGTISGMSWDHRPGSAEALDIAEDCYMLADAMLAERERDR